MRTSPKINKTKKSCKKATTVPTVKQEQEEALLAIARSTATRATSGTKNRGRVMSTAKAAKNGVRKSRTKTPATTPASITLVGIDKGKEKEENLPDSAGEGDSRKSSPSMSADRAKHACESESSKELRSCW